MSDPAPWTMRAACRFGCGTTEGTIMTENGQDVVRCSACGRANYNAPKTETGRAVRPVAGSEREPLKPSLRVEILERDGARCQLCGKRENLHIGHCVPLALAKEHPEWLAALGLSADDLNDTLNLVTLCDVCNLGMGSRPLATKLYVLLLAKWHRIARRAA